MLIFVADDFLEAVDSEVEELLRAKSAIGLESADGQTFELQAWLCLQKRDGQPLCQLAFYLREAKRALVYLVSGEARPDELMAEGRRALERFGAQLEPVNLNFSPGIRQTLLQEIPAIRTPAAAEKNRQERAAELEGLALAAEPPAEGAGEAQGAAAQRKAASRLASEQRKAEKLRLLRQLLEEALFPAEVAPGPASPEFAELQARLVAMEETLTRSEQRAAQERRDRERLEQTLASAEARLQELEGELVDAEKRLAGERKKSQSKAKSEKRIGELTSELQAALARLESEAAAHQGLAAELAKATARGDDLQAELQRAQSRLAELDACVKDLTAAQDRLVRQADDLKEARARAAEADADRLRSDTVGREAEGRSKELEQELAAVTAELDQAKAAATELTSRLDEATAGRDAERRRGVQLAEELASARERCDQLAKAPPAAVAEPDPGDAAVAQRQVAELRAGLKEALACVAEERAERERLESELAAVRQGEPGLAKGAATVAPLPGGDPGGAEALREAQERLRQEVAEREKLAGEQAAAARRLAEVEKELAEALAQVRQLTETASLAPAKGASEGQKPLPHLLRPPPKPGAFFHVDWDLEELPCSGLEQIEAAWQSVFNVQLSIEGYPGQYCAAFLVILRLAGVRRLYMAFRLSKTKRTLVFAPAKPPSDEAGFKQAMEEARKYLKVSGVELDKVAPEEMRASLGPILPKL